MKIILDLLHIVQYIKFPIINNLTKNNYMEKELYNIIYNAVTNAIKDSVSQYRIPFTNTSATDEDKIEAAPISNAEAEKPKVTRNRRSKAELEADKQNLIAQAEKLAAVEEVKEETTEPVPVEKVEAPKIAKPKGSEFAFEVSTKGIAAAFRSYLANFSSAEELTKANEWVASVIKSHLKADATAITVSNIDEEKHKDVLLVISQKLHDLKNPKIAASADMFD